MYPPKALPRRWSHDRGDSRLASDPSRDHAQRRYASATESANPIATITSARVGRTLRDGRAREAAEHRARGHDRRRRAFAVHGAGDEERDRRDVADRRAEHALHAGHPVDVGAAHAVQEREHRDAHAAPEVAAVHADRELQEHRDDRPSARTCHTARRWPAGARDAGSLQASQQQRREQDEDGDDRVEHLLRRRSTSSSASITALKRRQVGGREPELIALSLPQLAPVLLNADAIDPGASATAFVAFTVMGGTPEGHGHREGYGRSPPPPPPS